MKIQIKGSNIVDLIERHISAWVELVDAIHGWVENVTFPSVFPVGVMVRLFT